MLILVPQALVAEGLIRAEAAMRHGYDVVLGSAARALGALGVVKPSVVVATRAASEQASAGSPELVRCLRSSASAGVPVLMLMTAETFAEEACRGIAEGWWKGVYCASPSDADWMSTVDALVGRRGGGNRVRS